MRPVVCLLLGALGACAHAPPPRPREMRVQMEPLIFRVRPSGGVELLEAAGLFERAGAAFSDKRFDSAVALYDQVLGHFPDSRYRLASHYNAGLALEGKGDLEAAAERYRRLIDEVETNRACPESGSAAACEDALDAVFRLGGVHERLEHWDAAAELWQALLAKPRLKLADRIEAMSRQGAAQVQLLELDAAERSLRATLALYRENQTIERLGSDYFLGMATYYLGEVAHARFRALPVRLPERRLTQDLEAKARMLLEAQSRYLAAVKVQDSNWATAAGFQIGSLYREFYQALVEAPVPPRLSEEAKQVYQEQVRRRVRGLLEKAASIHEKNLLMAERGGIRNDWVRRSSEQMEQLQNLLIPGSAAPEVLPPPEPRPPLPRPRDHAKPRIVGSSL